MCISWLFLLLLLLLLLSSTLMLEFLGEVICLGWIGIRVGKNISKGIILITHITIHSSNVQAITNKHSTQTTSFKHIFRQQNIFATSQVGVFDLNLKWWSNYMVHLRSFHPSWLILLEQDLCILGENFSCLGHKTSKMMMAPSFWCFLSLQILSKISCLIRP